MTEKILARVQSFGPEIAAAKEEWNAYTPSLPSLEDTRKKIMIHTASPFTVKIKTLDRLVTALCARVYQLKARKSIMPIHITSTERLIGSNLPSRLVGTETGTSVLLHALHESGHCLLQAYGLTMAGEESVTRRLQWLSERQSMLLEYVSNSDIKMIYELKAVRDMILARIEESRQDFTEEELSPLVGDLEDFG